ncbi:family 43 glycosylhydrolase [Salana multivorans]
MPDQPPPASHPHPLATVPCHDPYVLPVADGATGAEYPAPEGTGVLAWWSPDLLTWGSPRLVFTVPRDSWADPAAAPWAPEVHEWDGRYVLATTLHHPGDTLPPVRQRGTRLTLSHADHDRYTFAPSRRGTVLAVADDPSGPFELLDPTASHTPRDFMALDGTLTRDEHGRPWLVYAHERVQIINGTIEAVPLEEELRPAGEPVHLFRASEDSWFARPGAVVPSTQALAPYVTDGPQLMRLPGGGLGMLWASYRTEPGFESGEYVETQAISRSGSLLGPWEQSEVLVAGNAGHGMLFRRRRSSNDATNDDDAPDTLVLHRGMNTPRVRAEIYAVTLTPSGVELGERLA